MCGAVRYEVRAQPTDCGWCHCRTCQRNSGAPAMVFASVPAADFVWTSGNHEVRTIRSSASGQRSFCGSCGTPFLMQEDAGDMIDFSVSTLDDPTSMSPGFHIFWSSRLDWFNPADQLPRYERFRSGAAEHPS